MTKSESRTTPVQVKILPHGKGLPLPRYMSQGAAGMDLMAAVEQPVQMAPGQRVKIPTGLAIALPEGYEAQVRPRSGLAIRHGVTCLNTPGTIDSDYRGEIQVILVNLGQESFQISRGERIAQMIVAPVTRIEWNQTEQLPETHRNEGGFGHTGR